MLSLAKKSENKWDFCILTSESFLLHFYLECSLFLNVSHFVDHIWCPWKCPNFQDPPPHLFIYIQNFSTPLKSPPHPIQLTMEKQLHRACERMKSKPKQVKSHWSWPRPFLRLPHKQCNGIFFWNQYKWEDFLSIIYCFAQHDFWSWRKANFL